MSQQQVAALFDVTGKVAVVTGGSRGIGLVIARGLLEAGAEVLISSRKADAVDAAVAELSAYGTVSGFAADVSSEAGVAALAAAVAERHPKVHLLFNNAGATWGAPIEEFPTSGFEKILATNVQGVFALTSALLPQLRAAATPEDPARVINIGSVDGLRVPMMENYSYSASKAAVHMLTRHLAKRLASEHITVNAIAPGPFESKMTAFMLASPEGRDAVASTVPLGRIGSDEDIIGTSLFLSSRAGAYLTGAIVPLDGGIVGLA
ncbi:MAG: SDR family oxidoreductase [Solirubrobacteraceae bacterium]|nr:SDR family oxidoreductase [Solirubrobacteraceae bacterium]